MMAGQPDLTLAALAQAEDAFDKDLLARMLAEGLYYMLDMDCQLELRKKFHVVGETDPVFTSFTAVIAHVRTMAVTRQSRPSLDMSQTIAQNPLLSVLYTQFKQQGQGKDRDKGYDRQQFSRQGERQEGKWAKPYPKKQQGRPQQGRPQQDDQSDRRGQHKTPKPTSGAQQQGHQTRPWPRAQNGEKDRKVNTTGQDNSSDDADLQGDASVHEFTEEEGEVVSTVLLDKYAYVLNTLAPRVHDKSAKVRITHVPGPLLLKDDGSAAKCVTEGYLAKENIEQQYECKRIKCTHPSRIATATSKAIIEEELEITFRVPVYTADMQRKPLGSMVLRRRYGIVKSQLNVPFLFTNPEMVHVGGAHDTRDGYMTVDSSMGRVSMRWFLQPSGLWAMPMRPYRKGELKTKGKADCARWSSACEHYKRTGRQLVAAQRPQPVHVTRQATTSKPAGAKPSSAKNGATRPTTRVYVAKPLSADKDGFTRTEAHRSFKWRPSDANSRIPLSNKFNDLIVEEGNELAPGAVLGRSVRCM
jgi:hypothetical protein